MTATQDDTELKARHRAMWASGDYPRMVETFLLPLGPRLVEACGIGAERSRARRRGRHRERRRSPPPSAARTSSRATSRPSCSKPGAAAGRRAGHRVGRPPTPSTCRSSPASFDVVMSSIGVMFAPHHQAAADELVRVCRPGGTIGLLSWTPEGMLGALFRTMKPFAAPPPPGVQSPPLWGSEEHLAELFGDRVMFGTLRRDVLEITAFERRARLRRALQGLLRPDDRRPRQRGARRPRGRVRRRARRVLRRVEPRRARFEKEYLLAVGTRAG